MAIVFLALNGEGFTDEVGFQDWLEQWDRIVSVISLVSQRIGLAVISAGLAIAGSTLMATERSMGVGQATLGLSAVFTVGFVVSTLLNAKRDR